MANMRHVQYEGDLTYVPLTETYPASGYWGINITSSTYGTHHVIPTSTAGVVDTGGMGVFPSPPPRPFFFLFRSNYVPSRWGINTPTKSTGAPGPCILRLLHQDKNVSALLCH